MNKVFLVFLIFMFFLISCGDNSDNNVSSGNETCKSDRDCNEGLVCIDGKCEDHRGEEGYSCNPDESCNEGLVCIDGKCEDLKGSLGYECLDNQTCNNGFSCKNNICVNENDKVWTKLFGTNKWDSGYASVSDNNGNIFICGRISGSLDGVSSYGKSDVVLIKLDDDGNRIWTRIYGTALDDFASDIAVDKSGNIYITGNTMGNLDGEINRGGNDIFLIKLNNNGDLIWTKLFGTVKEEDRGRIALDSDNNIILTGNTFGNFSNDGNNHGYMDIFVVKINENGNKIWDKQFGTNQYDSISDIITDDNGNIFLTGTTKGNFQNNISFGMMDLFLIKLDNNGGFIWSKQLGSSKDDRAFSLTRDTSGNIFVTGVTAGSFDNHIIHGTTDVILIKFNEDGNKLWSKQFGSGGDSSGYSVISNSFNEVFVAVNEQNIGGKIKLYKFSFDGENIWDKTVNSDCDDHASALATDKYDNLFMVGTTCGNLDGNINNGDTDIFLIKFGIR